MCINENSKNIPISHDIISEEKRKFEEKREEENKKKERKIMNKSIDQ